MQSKSRQQEPVKLRLPRRYVVLLTGLASAWFILACSLLGTREATRPTVVITFPQAGSSLSVGQEVIVQGVAVDTQGVGRIELWVDGQAVMSQTVAPPATSYTANQSWIPQVAGRHILELRAYNLADQSGEPAQVVVTVANPAIDAAQLPVETVPPPVTGNVIATGTPAGSPVITGPVVTSLVELNVRAGPGVEYPAIGALSAGQSAPITGRNPAGTWWQIIYRSGSSLGWVSGSAKYSSAQNTEGVPVVEVPPPPTPTPTATSTPSPTPSPTATPTRRPLTFGLTADRDVVALGESVTLRWNLNNVRTAYLRYNGLEEAVGVPGNKTLYPITTTVYTLVAGAETVAQLTVKVTPAVTTTVPVLRDGKTRIAGGQSIDFDQGIIFQGNNTGSDFYWDGRQPKFVPQTGSSAALVDLPFARITLTDCRRADYTGAIPGTAASQVTGCYQTGEGRYGKFLVSEWDNAGNLTLEWLTWDYR